MARNSVTDPISRTYANRQLQKQAPMALHNWIQRTVWIIYVNICYAYDIWLYDMKAWVVVAFHSENKKAGQAGKNLGHKAAPGIMECLLPQIVQSTFRSLDIKPGSKTAKIPIHFARSFVRELRQRHSFVQYDLTQTRRGAVLVQHCRSRSYRILKLFAFNVFSNPFTPPLSYCAKNAFDKGKSYLAEDTTER